MCQSQAHKTNEFYVLANYMHAAIAKYMQGSFSYLVDVAGPIEKSTYSYMYTIMHSYIFIALSILCNCNKIRSLIPTSNTYTTKKRSLCSFGTQTPVYIAKRNPRVIMPLSLLLLYTRQQQRHACSKALRNKNSNTMSS